MKQYIVKITDEALADMERLYHYIACDLQSPEYALAQYNRIVEKIMKLFVFLKSGSKLFFLSLQRFSFLLHGIAGNLKENLVK